MTVRARAFLVLVALLGSLTPSSALLGQTNCELVSSRSLRNVETGAGPVVYISRPRFLCDDGARINADSSQVFTNRNLSQFYGKVEFEDSTTVLAADRADFFSLEGRLHARGDVVLTDRSDGSTITGDTLLYLRPTETREQARITVTGHRPHAELYPAPPVPDSLDAAQEGEGGEADPGRVLDETAEPFVARGAQGDSTATPEPFVARGAEDDSVSEGADTAVEPEDTVRTPWDVDADRIFLEGSRYFRATGDVEIRRDSTEAFADSVVYDQRAGRLFLNSSARMLGGSFELLGRDMVMVLPGDEPREIIAGPEAFLVGQGLEVEAPRIHLFMEEGAVHRMVAVMSRDSSSSSEAGPGRMAQGSGARDALRRRGSVRGRGGLRLPMPGDSTREAAVEPPPGPAARDTAGPAQPRAVAEDFVLTGDSIEALTPNQELERVLAAGSARGVSTGRDSLNSEETPDVARNDWLQGDTILAYFVPDSLPGGGAGGVEPSAEGAGGSTDSDRGSRIDRIVAVGSATSLYRLAPRSDSTEQSDSTRAEESPPPHQRIALHFVEGDVITIHLEGQEVREMEVEGQTRGLYLEPRPQRPPPRIQARPAPADSAGAPATGSGPSRVPPSGAGGPP